MRLLISDEVHQRPIRWLGREVLTALEAAPEKGGKLTMSLDPEQMKIMQSAMKLMMDDLQREQASQREILRSILNKLPDEQTMHAIDLDAQAPAPEVPDMATRSGNVDPGLLLWLLQHTGMATGDLASALEHDSGLKGLAGTGDMRVVLTRASDGDAASTLALEIWEHRLRGLIAGMAAALGGLNAQVFTGGIGERSAPLRARAMQGLGFLGLAIDAERNQTAHGDRELTDDGAMTRTLVIQTREDLEIARQTRTVLASG